MIVKRALIVAGIVLAVAGCGDDGNDANGGWVPARSSGAADQGSQIQVIEVSGASEGGASHGGDDATPHEEPADTAMAETEAAEDDDGHDADVADHATDDSDREAEEPHDEESHDAGSDHEGDGAPSDSGEPDHDALAVAAGPSDVGNVVQVAVVEFGYVLDRDTVPVGEPVTFRFVNEGQIEHEAMFGDLHQQEEFASSEGHGDHGSEGHHGEIAAITLDAAATGEMVMVFESPGEVLIGCHLPGHWDAGMVASLDVVTA